jgi:hypothetical protein
MMIAENGVTLTDDERASLMHVAQRLDADRVSLYRTSEGLRAYVIDTGGGEHVGVAISRATP